MTRRSGLTAPAFGVLLAATFGGARADAAGVPVAVGARFAQDAAGAALVFDLSDSVPAEAYGLDAPVRIVVDLPEVNFRVDPGMGRANTLNAVGPVKAFRFGQMTAGRSRIVFDLDQTACPAGIESKPIAEGLPAARLTIRLKPCDATAFAAIRRSPAATAVETPASPNAPPVIVLDPGHGGVDGGARGIGGVAEKAVVWDFCSELKRQLEAEGRYKIIMTREGDRYVGLDERVTIGRDANAALFISVHADTLTEAAEVGGATVYTASERASDAEAARIAARENAADSDGKSTRQPENDPGVSDILADLRRRETRAYAHLFSHGLAGNLAAVTRLNHNPERSAGFVVLKAPEFPSVLVELGYLSNAQDMRALTSPEWRQRAVAAMVRAIDRFFSAPAAPGVAANDPGAATRPQAQQPSR